MRKSKKPDVSVLPDSGNEEADCAWARLLAQRDIKLYLMGDSKFMATTMPKLVEGKSISKAESVYFMVVFGSLLSTEGG